MLQQLLSNAFTMVLIILVINIVYVSFSTMRLILTMKGRRYAAAFAGTVEMLIYVIGLSIVPACIRVHIYRFWSSRGQTRKNLYPTDPLLYASDRWHWLAHWNGDTSRIERRNR